MSWINIRTWPMPSLPAISMQWMVIIGVLLLLLGCWSLLSGAKTTNKPIPQQNMETFRQRRSERPPRIEADQADPHHVRWFAADGGNGAWTRQTLREDGAWIDDELDAESDTSGSV